MTNGHNEQQAIVTGERKGQKNEALNLADFEIDDILSMPGERLLAEVGEDFGDPASLAAEFDAIALPLLSSAQGGAADWAAAASVSAVAQTASGIASRRTSPAAPPSAPSSFRHAIRAAAELVAAPLRSRAVLGAFATLLLLAVLAPGVYPLLVKRAPVEQAAERPAPASQNDLPPQSAPALSQLKAPVPAVPVQPSLAAEPASPPAAAPFAAAPPTATPKTSPPTGQEKADVAAPIGRQVLLPRVQAPKRASAPPQVVTTTVEPATPPPAAAPEVGREGGATLPPPPHGGGFVVQLSIWSSEAQAQSSFRTLKSKYAVLNGREPLIKRTDDGRRGTSYALQVGPFESSMEAEQLCAHLKASGGACAVRGN
jgi:SPOR domain